MNDIRDTIERFHDGVNQRKPELIALLFTVDGVWEVAPPYEHRFEGRAAIEQGMTGTINATKAIAQTIGPVVIDVVDDTHATARTSMVEFIRFNDGKSIQVAGTYFDTLVKLDGLWRFSHRRFVANDAL